jgi:type IX secretion system substrate protein/PKD domain-containing protein
MGISRLLYFTDRLIYPTMKKYLYVLLVVIMCFHKSGAQTGWQWGVGSLSRVGGVESIAGTVDNAGNYLMAGLGLNDRANPFPDTITFGPLSVNVAPHLLQEIVVVKTDSSGNFLWTLSAPNCSSAPVGIGTDSSGNAYILGYYDNSVLTFDTVTIYNHFLPYDMFFIAKITPAGRALWAQNVSIKAYVGVAFSLNTNSAIDVDAAGNVYVTGTFSGPVDTIGSVGLTNADPSGITADIFIAKYNTAGNLVWAKSYGGKKDDWPTALALTSGGHFYLAGASFSDSLNIGASMLTASFIGTVDSNTFLCRFDTSGSPGWAQNINAHIGVNYLVADKAENVFLTGKVDSSIILGTDTLNVSVGATGFFLGKYDSAGRFKWARSSDNSAMFGATNSSLYDCNIWSIGGMAGNMNFSGHPVAWPGGRDPVFLTEYSTDSGKYLSTVTLLSGGDDWNSMTVDKKGNFYVGCDYWTLPLVVGTDTLPAQAEENLFVARYRYDTVGCKTCATTAVTPSYTDTGATTFGFTYTGTTTYDSISWVFGDGTTSTALNPTHTYTVSGTYHACVLIFSPCAVDGTYAEYCHDVTVTIPADTTTLVGNTGTLAGAKLQPNPTTGSFTLTLPPSTTPANITITNLLGSIIETRTIQNTQSRNINFNLHTAPGTYIIQVTTGPNTWRQKIEVR